MDPNNIHICVSSAVSEIVEKTSTVLSVYFLCKWFQSNASENGLLVLKQNHLVLFPNKFRIDGVFATVFSHVHLKSQNICELIVYTWVLHI